MILCLERPTYENTRHNLANKSGLRSLLPVPFLLLLCYTIWNGISKTFIEVHYVLRTLHWDPSKFDNEKQENAPLSKDEKANTSEPFQRQQVRQHNYSLFPVEWLSRQQLDCRGHKQETKQKLGGKMKLTTALPVYLIDSPQGEMVLRCTSWVTQSSTIINAIRCCCCRCCGRNDEELRDASCRRRTIKFDSSRPVTSIHVQNRIGWGFTW